MTDKPEDDLEALRSRFNNLALGVRTFLFHNPNWVDLRDELDRATEGLSEWDDYQEARENGSL